jgi:hypothetical protein
VAKLNPTGSSLVFSTYLGGGGDEFGDPAIGVDGRGDVYVASATPSADFPITPGAFQTSLSGSNDGFVTKLNPTGRRLIYSTYLGGSDFDLPESNLVVDPRRRVFLDGLTISNDFPVTSDAYQTRNAGGADAFVIELNRSGSALVHATYLRWDGG